jgi:hypothetical protein
MTSFAAQTTCQGQNEKQAAYKIAFKHTTMVYSREKAKNGGMSAQDVSDLIKSQFQENVNVQTIQQNVKKGKVGSSPVQRGPKGYIPKIHYKNLLMAFESFVTFDQINGAARECRHKKLALHVHQVLHTTPTESKSRGFLKCVLCDSAVNIKATKGVNRRDSHIWWTTYKSLLLWFDNGEHDLVKLRFACHDPITNKICIRKEQLTKIVNFDEICRSLDGSMQNHGGRPEVTLYNPRFPQVGGPAHLFLPKYFFWIGNPFFLKLLFAKRRAKKPSKVDLMF